jgi:hypothetical protein
MEKVVRVQRKGLGQTKGQKSSPKQFLLPAFNEYTSRHGFHPAVIENRPMMKIEKT